jgi:hypothetical protein
MMNTINVPFAIAALWVFSGAGVALALQSVQPAFPSTNEASTSLFHAVQSNNEQAICTILGGPTDLTSSTDPGQDRTDREMFVQKYQEMHRLRSEPDGSVTLYLGAENWPFPVPLVKDKGSWRFDADAGKREVLLRRIGENELIVMTSCDEFVDAVKRYRAESNSGDATDSSPASLVAKAASGSGGGDPVLLHGYYFRLIQGKALGGFAFIAYPAEYRSSGVMTFIVTKNGVVYEKDLGANTGEIAGAMAAFHKDATWTPAGE